MAKLGDFTNPVTGQRGSITDLGGILSMVKGVVVLLAVFGIGSWLFGTVKRMAPGGLGGIMGTNNILNPAPAGATQVTNAGPTVTLWK